MSEQAALQTQTETISEADVTDSGSQVCTFVTSSFMYVTFIKYSVDAISGGWRGIVGDVIHRMQIIIVLIACRTPISPPTYDSASLEYDF